MITVSLRQQLLRFVIVGILAACVHMLTVLLLVQANILMPLQANIFGFLLGFQLSYYGHRNFTFQHSSVLHRVALPKLFILQTSNFVINEYLFYCFLSLQLPYPLALFIVLAIMPLVTFVLSKYFVFS